MSKVNILLRSPVDTFQLVVVSPFRDFPAIKLTGLLRHTNILQVG